MMSRRGDSSTKYVGGKRSHVASEVGCSLKNCVQCAFLRLVAAGSVGEPPRTLPSSWLALQGPAITFEMRRPS